MSLKLTSSTFSPSLLFKPDNKLCCSILPVFLKSSRFGRICASGAGSSSTSNDKETALVEHYLKPLWDDGYGTKTVKDYDEATKDVIHPDGGRPLRWFSPIESGPPLEDSPVLLFLPGNPIILCVILYSSSI